jgi:hypothetical protein
MVKGIDRLYLLSVLMLTLILPIISILVEVVTARQAPDLWNLVGRWFVFSAVGVRFVTAAVRQVVNPSFTAEEILRIHSKKSHAIVRELGFANFCLGLVGMLSLLVPEWCTAAALGGGLYMGFAGLQHILKRPASPNEIIAMLSDMFVFLVLVAYMFHAA